jgi:hypothetical protein
VIGLPADSDELALWGLNVEEGVRVLGDGCHGSRRFR